MDSFNEGLKTSTSKDSRLILVHAGGEQGFVPSTLLLYKSTWRTEICHSEMNGENHKKWREEKLIPNYNLQCIVLQCAEEQGPWF